MARMERGLGSRRFGNQRAWHVLYLFGVTGGSSSAQTAFGYAQAGLATLKFISEGGNSARQNR